MNWLGEKLFGNHDLTLALTNVGAAVTELRTQQAEIIKVLMGVNQSLSKLILQKSQEPDEMTNAQRAALIGLPPAMADLVDWDQVRGRR